MATEKLRLIVGTELPETKFSILFGIGPREEGAQEIIYRRMEELVSKANNRNSLDNRVIATIGIRKDMANHFGFRIRPPETTSRFTLPKKHP